jgi:serine/threonine protein kinase/tetratricopeptide (TPR) repeat protein
MISPGDKVKHYEIIESIGKGGMGEVYLARDTVLDREVAIKFLPEEMQKDARARERFLREAKSAAALDHPFICQIYETGEIEGKAFIAMEYVEGKNLSQRMQEGRLPLKDALQTTLEIAEALEVAHKKGIVHRDLKPANIMLTVQGHAKVMDFGLAKHILPGEESLTKTLTQTSLTEKGTIVGTIAYMSPEQTRGESVDGRSDIFALGIILHEMISGKNPFSKPTPVETLTSILRDAPPPLGIKPKNVNPLLSPIIRKVLAKEPAERYQSIAELAAEIKKVQRQVLAGSRLLYRTIPIIIASAAVVAILVASIWWFALRGKVAKPPPSPKPVSILIADLKNETGDPVFDGALEYAMSIGLEGAPFITTYKRPNARQLANKLNPNANGKLDSEMAQLVCIREGINMFMDGLISPKDSGYTLKVWTRDPLKPEKATEYTKTISSKGEVLTTAAWLANKVISDLGGTPAESAKELAGETFTTSSLDAIKAYNNAQELSIIGKQEEAIKEYLRAINLDSNFGRAYSGLALVYHNRGQFEEREKYFDIALAKIDLMCEREKYRTMAIYYLIHRNFQKAIEELTGLLKKYPADYAGRTNLALAYFYARNYSQAKEVGRQAVDLYPKNSMSRFNLSWYGLADGDIDLAEQQAQVAIDNSPGYEKAYVVLALSKFMKGESAEAFDVYDKLKTISPMGESLVALGLADIALYEGRLVNGTEILEKRIALDTKEGRTDYIGNKWALLAYMRLLSRKNSLALEAADHAVVASKEIGTRFYAVQVYIEAGKEDKAVSIAAELNKQLGPEPRAYAKLIEGEILKKDGKISEAIELFNQAQGILDTWLGRFTLGKAYLDIEAFPDAHKELDSCSKHPGEAASVFFNDVPSLHFLPLIYYYLGRAQEGLRSPAAAESYQKFLKIKANSDKGDPLVEDCLRRLATAR